MSSQTFGNSIRTLRGFLLSVAVLAVALSSIFFFTTSTDASPIVRALDSILLAGAIAAIPFVAVLPTLAFSLHISEESITHLFLDQFVLSRLRMEDLESVGIATGWGAVLKFRGGSKIRFLGAHLEELRTMCRYIEQLRPGRVDFGTGVAGAALLSMSDKLKRDA